MSLDDVRLVANLIFILEPQLDARRVGTDIARVLLG